MAEFSAASPQISIGSLRRKPGVSASASAEALQGVQNGLAVAAAAAAQVSPGRIRLSRLAVRLRQGAGPGEIAEAVRGAVAAAIRERRG